MLFRSLLTHYSLTIHSVLLGGQIRNLCEALGIDEQADLTEEEANLQLKEHSIAIDGVVVADVGAGIVQRVRAKLQRCV